MARKRRRRIWEDDEKRRIVAQTRVPGVSVSQVARRYDVNANMVFKWLRDPRFKLSEDDLPSFLPVEVTATEVSVPPEPVSGPCDGRIEIALASGHRLTLSGSFDPDAVVRLARGLNA